MTIRYEDFKSSHFNQKGSGVLTTVWPIATPAAVEATWPSRPGCDGRAALGCATFAGGLGAGTERLGAGGAAGFRLNTGEERPDDLLPPRGILNFQL